MLTLGEIFSFYTKWRLRHALKIASFCPSQGAAPVVDFYSFFDDCKRRRRTRDEGRGRVGGGIDGGRQLSTTFAVLKLVYLHRVKFKKKRGKSELRPFPDKNTHSRTTFFSFLFFFFPPTGSIDSALLLLLLSACAVIIHFVHLPIMRKFKLF